MFIFFVGLQTRSHNLTRDINSELVTLQDRMDSNAMISYRMMYKFTVKDRMESSAMIHNEA